MERHQFVELSQKAINVFETKEKINSFDNMLHNEAFLITCMLSAVPASARYKSTQSTDARVSRYLMSSLDGHTDRKGGVLVHSGAGWPC